MNNKQNERFVLSRLYITLFVGFLFVALFTLTYTQQAVEGITLTVYEVATRQIMFAMVGFSILMMSVLGGAMVFDWKNRYEPDPMDEERGWMIYGLFALVGARVAGAILTAVPMSAIGFLSGSVALTSAIFEEPIFCGIGLMFYSIFLRLLKRKEMPAIIGSTVVVAGLFAMIHIGVYGLSLAAMLYLMVGRIVYNLAFLKTRTILTPTFAHVGHNFLVAFLGV
jgi:membrane protease YdiL (CAAX protease family)